VDRLVGRVVARELVVLVSRRLGRLVLGQPLGRLLLLFGCGGWIFLHSPIVAVVGILDGWKHCPRCGAAVEPTGGKLECDECGFVTYANSKPTASAVVVDDEGRVMFSKRGREPYAGKWDLPGGFLDEDEHPLDGLHRELREEAGIGLADTRFVGIFMDRYGEGEGVISTLNLYWSARISEGTPEPDDDVAEFRFFAVDEIPSDELAFGHLRDVISAWRSRDEHT